VPAPLLFAIRLAVNGIRSQESGLRAAEATLTAEHIVARESDAEVAQHRQGIQRMRAALADARVKLRQLIATAEEHGFAAEDIAGAADLSIDEIDGMRQGAR
jgi:DNA-directed RNA polymerase specialized sigma24 family protein